MTDTPDLNVSYLTIMWKDETIEVDGNVNTAESIGLMVLAIAAQVMKLTTGDGEEDE